MQFEEEVYGAEKSNSTRGTDKVKSSFDQLYNERHFFVLLFVLRQELMVFHVLLVCLPVHLCVNKRPPEYFYVCNCVTEQELRRIRKTEVN